jgi:hypothetical protein
VSVGEREIGSRVSEKKEKVRKREKKRKRE